MSAFSEASVESPRIGAPSKLDAIRLKLDDDSRRDFDYALLHERPADIHRKLEALGFELCVTTVAHWCRKARARVRVQ